MICDIRIEREVKEQKEKPVQFQTKSGLVDIDLNNITLEEYDNKELSELEYGESKQYLIKHENTELGRIYVGNISGGGTEISIMSSEIFNATKEIENIVLQFFYTILDKLGIMKFKNGRIKINAGKGIGEVAYVKMAQELYTKHGLILTSDTKRSEFSNNLWEKLVSKGIAEKIEINSEEADFIYQFKSPLNQFKEIPECI